MAFMEVEIRGHNPLCEKCGGWLLVEKIDIAQPEECYVYYRCKDCLRAHCMYHIGGQLYSFTDRK